MTRQIIGPIIFLALAAPLAGCHRLLDRYAEQFIFSGLNGPPKYELGTGFSAFFTSEPGVTLASEVYLPEGVNKVPTILVRIPLTKTFSNELRTGVIARYWARRGYAVVIQGTRGRYGSGGEFYPLVHEREDGIATLRWLSTQPWYDGTILMWGGSAFGHTQWAVADQKKPGANGFAVQIASSNFREMFYPGGAFALESALYWALRSRPGGEREVSLAQLDRSASKIPLSAAEDQAVGDTPYYNDWVEKQNDEKYWKTIDGHNRAKTIAAPMFMIAGWFDPFLAGQLEDFENILRDAAPEVAKETSLTIGPWAHAQSVAIPNLENEIPYRAASVELSTAWFDHLLGRTKTKFPKVRIFVMGINQWRNEDSWPLSRAQVTPFYLASKGVANSVDGNGRLSLAPPNSAYADRFQNQPQNPVPTRGGAMLSSRAGIALQNEIEQRNDVLVYTTDALTEPLEITGPISLDLYVTTEASSADFTAKLVDVHPDGKAYNVSEGVLRKDFPQPMSEPRKITILMSPTSNVYLAGHCLRLEVAGSNFPHYDRNLTSENSTQSVHHSAKYPSVIYLPLVPPQ